MCTSHVCHLSGAWAIYFPFVWCVKAHTLQRESTIFESIVLTYTRVIVHGNFLEVI